MSNELKGGDALELSTDINVITAEIKVEIARVGESIYRIGERLQGVRDNPKVYGFKDYHDWERWCTDEFNMTRQHANRFIRIVEELGTSMFRNAQLGVAVLYQIATMPEESRTESHTIPSTGAEKTPDEMTVRELREVKAELKKTQEQRDAERKERERIEQEEPEVVTEYVEVDNTPHDYDEVKRRLEDYHEKFGDIRNYDDSVTATHVQDMISATMSFKKAVKEFARRFSYMTKYKDAISRMDHISKQEYNETVKVLHEMADSFDYLEEDTDRIIINQ